MAPCLFIKSLLNSQRLLFINECDINITYTTKHLDTHWIPEERNRNKQSTAMSQKHYYKITVQITIIEMESVRLNGSK